MAAVVIAFNGTRVNAADVNTNWGNLGGGGPPPAAEPQLKYQGSNAVNRKVATTASRTGVNYDHSATASYDMTAAANRLWFIKAYVADFGDLNAAWGCEVQIGSSPGDYYDYNIAGSGANRGIFGTYPNQGGYLILALDPNIAGWREGQTGTPVLTAIDYWGFAAQFVAGGAKSENMALDSIDIGTGLTLTGGSDADPDGDFQDFVDADEGDPTNGRWGVVQSKFGAIIGYGLLTIGSATETDFNDQDAVVLFPDGYHSAGLVGILCDIQNANSVIDIGATIIGGGAITTEDTRPDFIVTGTSGSFDFSGTLSNHRNVTLTSVCNISSAVMEMQLLTQASANISDSTIITTSLTSIATLQDPTFGTSIDLHDVAFIQGGAGHAIELDTATDYTLTNISFTGYGAIASDSAALDVTASSGIVNIYWSGGTEPTYKTAGATVNVINTVTLTVTCKNAAGNAIEGVRVRVETDPGGTLVSNGTTNASGIYEDTTYEYSADQAVKVIARLKGYKNNSLFDTITGTGLSVGFSMIRDEAVNLP